jgi:carbonic anhydrase/acetyltransferase-like protein (isoleucine patch superfamily)
MTLYSLDGKWPSVPEDGEYWVAPEAQVIGNVTLGRDVGIWFNAVLRGDNDPIEIGEGTNVQDGVIVHTDPGFPVVIGAGCTIGHRAIIHGCTIGENTLVGMGAIILNGARIGRNCLVGAGALVTEGKMFPDNSLIVGSPAKLVRSLDDAAVERLRASAVHYAANAKRFRAGLAA